MTQQGANVSDRWIQHKRANFGKSYACRECPARNSFSGRESLWEHAQVDHAVKIPSDEKEKQAFRAQLEADSLQDRASKESPSSKKSPQNMNSSAEPPLPAQIKRHLDETPDPATSVKNLQALNNLNINPPGSEDVPLNDYSEEDQPRKRAALGDGISAGSGSPFRQSSASPPPPTRSKARVNPISFSPTHNANHPDEAFESQRPHVEKKQLWTEHDRPLARSSFPDTSNFASVQSQKSRAQVLPPKNRRSFPSTQQNTPSRVQAIAIPNYPGPSLLRSTPTQSLYTPKDDTYDIILQPETRPISQEQLVAEVKGIYAGLVMVEAKCIEVDNKQTALGNADPSSTPRLNNEQWQALIALHRTLLHEHHDFFLASQHPSASPALRRLASKYAMPARMWRHGIHSFLELLRKRLPASLDHMLAFIYLAYSMMALLYETVPAFEDTWIECLGDLARYRMAIEDDDIRDREVWTGVARHWYSKASDKAPTTGRLYHHLAILARPVALQQLFYYTKSLCVVVPFSSARESILTLFDPVLNADSTQGHYRLPPLDTAFLKAHGILFTNRDIEKFDLTVKEFLALLDSQIGRVTRKFMEQGYYLAVANAVAILGYASKENPLMQALAEADVTPASEADDKMTGITSDQSTAAQETFEHAQHLFNSTAEIVLQRIGDPNVLPFLHVLLVFMRHMSRHPRAMRLLETKFPWQALTVMLNTLAGPYTTPARIEDPAFPLPVKDDVRPFTEDFAMRGLLWADEYYPDKWFSNERIDDDEKFLEVPSMTDDRKERILYLACRIAELGPWMYYKDKKFSTSPPEATPTAPVGPAGGQSLEPKTPLSRSETYASATTVGRTGTWASEEAGNASDGD